jgi:hypothetical protein
MERRDWPELSLAEWEPTYLTLHRWLQIVGKVPLALAPPLNHWWHVALQVTPRGLTTATLPTPSGAARVTFDFVDHALVVTRSHGRGASFPLEPMSVADFYDRALGAFRSSGVDVAIWPRPVEVGDRTPFPLDRHHRAYDRAQVERLHRVLLSVQHVFSVFRGRFLGKSSPVHLFWGAFDLAVTRFSGRRNVHPPDDRVTRTAYSHELISHGFWPGGDWPGAGRVEEAMFYAYAVPQPAGFAEAHAVPPAAHFDRRLGEFVLPYEVVRRESRPEATLLDFMETTYASAAERAGWARRDLEDAPREGSTPC